LKTKPDPWSSFKEADWEDAMVFVFDLKCRFLYVNDVAAEYLGRPESEFIGRKITDLQPKIIGTKNYDNLLRAVKGEHIHDTIAGFDGSLSEVDYKPINMEGKDHVAYVLVRSKKVIGAD
jgi:PAS domain-containing protein